ncbi:hypothetical protein AURDEDRAFT_188282 [Auricularia subglabra TFB-10046 SS5]|nr:hypothetical protein AURDEDRAFT_188282 [Auricularia subglabra TFB-10046 SS5]
MPNEPTQTQPTTQEITAYLENASNMQEKIQHLEETEDALRESEQRVNDVEEQNATLRRQLAEITNMSQRRARGSTNAPSDNEDEAPAAKRVETIDAPGAKAPRAALAEDAVQAGRKYAMDGMPWLLGHPPWEYFKTERDENFDPKARHDSDRNRVQGQLREIYNMLPTQLKPHFQEYWFAKEFNYGMRTQVSNTATRMRGDGVHILLPGEADHTLASEDRFEHFKERLGYQPAANGKPANYPPIECPLLHEGPIVDGEYELSKRFKPYYFKLIHILYLRGQMSARQALKHEGRIVKPQGDYMQEKHHITFTTPGAVAFCLILGRWVVSADDKLKSTGAQTTIDWQADFNDYLKILQQGLDSRSPTIRALFRDWDRLVFGLKRSRYGGTGPAPEEVRRTEVNATLEAIAAEEPEPSSEEEGEASEGGGDD